MGNSESKPPEAPAIENQILVSSPAGPGANYNAVSGNTEPMVYTEQLEVVAEANLESNQEGGVFDLSSIYNKLSKFFYIFAKCNSMSYM